VRERERERGRKDSTTESIDGIISLIDREISGLSARRRRGDRGEEIARVNARNVALERRLIREIGAVRRRRSDENGGPNREEGAPGGNSAPSPGR